jgi:hypothetical protein
MRQKRRKEISMTNKTSKTSKSNQTASKKVTSQKKKAAQGRRKATGKAAKPAKSTKVSAPSQPRPIWKKTDTPEAPRNPRAPKSESKGAQLLALIGREQGASLAELMQRAREWR